MAISHCEPFLVAVQGIPSPGGHDHSRRRRSPQPRSGTLDSPKPLRHNGSLDADA